MDVTAVVEGVKPIVDAMVSMGMIPDDKPEFVLGVDGKPFKTIGLPQIEISLWSPA